MKRILILALMAALTPVMASSKEKENSKKNDPEPRGAESAPAAVQEARKTMPDLREGQPSEARREQAPQQSEAPQQREAPQKSEAPQQSEAPQEREKGRAESDPRSDRPVEAPQVSPERREPTRNQERVDPSRPQGGMTAQETLDRANEAAQARVETEKRSRESKERPEATTNRPETTPDANMPRPAPAAEANVRVETETPKVDPAVPAPMARPTENAEVSPPVNPAVPAPTTRPEESRKRVAKDNETAESIPPVAAPMTARTETVQTPETAEKAVDPAARGAAEKIKKERTEAFSKAEPETKRVLEDLGRRDRDEDRKRAGNIKDDKDAETLVYSILGGAAAGAIAGSLASRDRDRWDENGRYHRLPADQVGRGPRDRDQSVNFLVQRFQGNAQWNEAPAAWRNHDRYDDRGHNHHQPYYFNGNRRVVYFYSYQSIPPILLAWNQLHHIEVSTVRESPYRISDADPGYYQNVPQAYRSEDAYALSYEVDPDSAVILDDILFEQGSTNFADAYSYDLVVDLADAMNSSGVRSDRFIVEGHASSEGDYGQNLQLSQERAERIARDLVSMGVAPDRIVPVGYGETEARYAENAPESERSLDRRVMVFRMKE